MQGSLYAIRLHHTSRHQSQGGLASVIERSAVRGTGGMSARADDIQWVTGASLYKIAHMSICRRNVP